MLRHFIMLLITDVMIADKGIGDVLGDLQVLCYFSLRADDVQSINQLWSPPGSSIIESGGGGGVCEGGAV